MGETSMRIDHGEVISERTRRAGKIARAGGIEEALGSGALSRFQDITLSEAVVLGLLRQGVFRFLCVLGHGSTDLGDVLRAPDPVLLTVEVLVGVLSYALFTRREIGWFLRQGLGRWDRPKAEVPRDG